MGSHVVHVVTIFRKQTWQRWLCSWFALSEFVRGTDRKTKSDIWEAQEKSAYPQDIIATRFPALETATKNGKNRLFKRCWQTG